LFVKLIMTGRYILGENYNYNVLIPSSGLRLVALTYVLTLCLKGAVSTLDFILGSINITNLHFMTACCWKYFYFVGREIFKNMS
jgi:hypothetical protein